ncbi:hypothetical protein ACEWY4_023253 [Coilia grayii]|uniref:BHLH domain-containing protein n=1 Tax=Coilia grayii TaxID=363190 RepID=A0ABD1J4E6_9TELE
MSHFLHPAGGDERDEKREIHWSQTCLRRAELQLHVGVRAATACLSVRLWITLATFSHIRVWVGGGGGGGGIGVGIGGPGLGLLQGPLQGPRGVGKALREMSMEEQQELRRKINSRERKRMQDLNMAMDALREVMVPYSSSSSSCSAGGGQHQLPLQQHPYLASSHSHSPGGPQAGRRLSKISTLVLARNYILLLASSLQEMRRLLGELSVGVNGGGVPRMLLAGGWPLLAGAPAGQLLLTPETLLAIPTPTSSSSSSSSSSASSSSKCPLLPAPAPLPQEEVVVWGSSGGAGSGVLAGMVGAGPLCPCGVCRVPRMMHPTPGPRFPK